MELENLFKKYRSEPEATHQFWASALKTKTLAQLRFSDETDGFQGYRPEAPPLTLLGDQSVIKPGQAPAGSFYQVDESAQAKPTIVPAGHSWSHPFSTVGKLFFVRKLGQETKLFSGTAFVVPSKNGNMVISAAHCLFSEMGKRYKRQWSRHLVFIPFYQEENRGFKYYFERGEVFYAEEFSIPEKWFSGNNYNRYEYDYGRISLRKENGQGELLQQLTGGLGWIAGPRPTLNKTGIAIAYPEGEGFSGGMWWSKIALSFQHFVTGHPHIRIRAHTFTEGASGGPIMVWDEDSEQYVAIGLHASISQQPSGLRYWDSPRFGTEFIRMLEEA